MKTKLLIISTILIFSSCGSLPKKPSIDLCSNIVSTQRVPCVNNQSRDSYILDYNETDKYLMLSPDHWGLILKYIRKLENRAGFKKEARKILKANKKLNVLKSLETLN